MAASASPISLGQREQPRAALALALDRLGEGLRPARADLDLGVDQLAGGRLGQQLVLQAGARTGPRSRGELERLRIDDRELLLEADGEVGRGLEQLPGALRSRVAGDSLRHLISMDGPGLIGSPGQVR